MKIAKKLIHIIFMLIIMIFVFTSCGQNTANDNSQINSDKPIVAVSIIPEETFVKKVCGELVDVIVMIPPGSEPENYEPTPKQMESFSKAEIYFTIGVLSEENSILPNVQENTKVVSLQDIVSSTYQDINIGDERDPHIWLSPKRAIVMVQAIADEMSKFDKENEKTYQENAKAFIEEIEAADIEIKQALEGVKTRKFIVYHPAFGYLADDYNLEMYALEEEGKEATAERLIQMVDLAKEEDIKVIFYQAEISSKQAQSFAEELGGEAVMLSPLSGDYIENLKLMAKTMSDNMQ